VLEIVLWICLAVGILFAADALLLWMEAKGWLYYRKVRRRGSASPGILEIASIFDPGARHSVAAQDQRAGEEDEDDGDDEAKRKLEDQVPARSSGKPR
jgi:hypothetical protein